MKTKIKAAVTVALLLVFAETSLGQIRETAMPLNIYTDINDLASARFAWHGGDVIDIDPVMVPLAAGGAFTMPVPTASGKAVQSNKKATIDYSNAKDGYVMVKFPQSTRKDLKVIIKGPSGTSYTYDLTPGIYEVFPLSDGNGTYTIGVYEQVQGTKYSVANTATVKVTLANEFAPFLISNQYVNFNKDNEVVKMAAQLTAGASGFTDKIAAVYNFVVNNFTYDKELARTVQSGYLPNLDQVLRRRQGICFDYAAVMTAMLRSLGIPCKLVVGYAGNVYHAWIDAYSQETGWVNQIIFFDGKNWTLMDPTFASSANQSPEIMKYIGNGNNYRAMFLY